MEISLSQSCIHSFVGNVVPLRLLGIGEYTQEPVCWASSAPCVQITSFAQDALTPFTDGVLLTFLSEGSACVTAALAGCEYRCEISVHNRMDVPSQKGLSYYIGDFHDHTAKTHNREEFAQRLERIPLDYLNQVADEGLLDFTVISDHADLLNSREYFRGFWDAYCLGEDKLIVFSGSEAEVSPTAVDRYGVSHKVGGEIVTVNAAGFANVPSWERFFACYETSPFAISVLAHPQIIGISRKGIWNFQLDKNRDSRYHKLIKGVEMGNGTDRESNHINEYVYSVALDNGFRVSTTCASDSHGPRWGAAVFPGKTILMAPGKSKEAFLDAIENRRFYASESGNVKLYYEVNGKAAPADLPLCDEYRFHVELGLLQPKAGDMPVKLQVISDYGKTLWETDDIQTEMDFTVASNTARYFYLRLLDPSGKKTWSVPVWTGRPFDVTPEDTLIPIEKAGTTAVDEANGQDASILLDDNPETAFYSKTPACSILIDLQTPMSIAALGHYPTMMDVKALRAVGGKQQDEVSRFPVRYQLETGMTPTSMEVKAEGLFRVFGAEELIRFPEHEARFVRLTILSTAGKESGRAAYANCAVSMAELTLYRKP